MNPEEGRLFAEQGDGVGMQVGCVWRGAVA